MKDDFPSLTPLGKERPQKAHSGSTRAEILYRLKSIDESLASLKQIAMFFFVLTLIGVVLSFALR